MTILSLDIGKKSTGVAIYDGSNFDGLQSIKFIDAIQWGNEVKKLFTIWKPNLVVFSETMNRMFSQDTKRIMYGLMYHLELICMEHATDVHVINDVQAKHYLDIKMNKENKQLTLKWANQFELVLCDDIADAMSFAYYIYHNFIK